MDAVQYVRKTELARNTRQILREVQRGRPAVVESHGQAEVAIIDIIDYYILRAVLRFYAQRSKDVGDVHLEVDSSTSEQERFDQVLADYMVGDISLARAGELLNLAWLDLRTRFARLDIPLRSAPLTADEANADVLAALNWD